MNLELIRKYETEFLHMLHGGKVLMGKKDPVTNTIKWYPSVLNPFVETSNTIVVVIDDMYCTYRKALAEGRTVQYMNSNGEIKSLDDWDNIGWKQFKGCVENYRIKPDEPEFKIGDYVRYIHANSPKPLQISNINCERYYFENAEIILRLDEIEKWEPREGEVCIFWNNDSNTAVIAKLRYIVSTGTYRTEHSYWDNCMPFTGALPPHIKD